MPIMTKCVGAEDYVLGSVVRLRFELLYGGRRRDQVGLVGLVGLGLVVAAVVLLVAGLSRRCRAGSISNLGAFSSALVSVLVSALVVERTLLVDAAAPFSIVLSKVVPFACVDSCPGKRVGNDGSR